MKRESEMVRAIKMSPGANGTGVGVKGELALTDHA